MNQDQLFKTLYDPRISGSLLTFRDQHEHVRAPRPKSKEYNQLLKSARRAATGKPSYRKRQASARAAKALRKRPRVTA